MEGAAGSILLRAPQVAEQRDGVRGRYKAKVSSVSPERCRDTFEKHTSCFLGVSLQNRNFTPQKFRGLLEWVSRRFSSCTILIGDGIHRITLEAVENLPEVEAHRESLRIGREFVTENARLIHEFATHTSFSVAFCSEIQKRAEYKTYLAELESLFDVEDEFRFSVEDFGRAYHEKHSAGVQPDEFARRLRRSSQYFLEEFAIFAYLQAAGHPVMVYPGSFSTLAEIAAGMHDNAPAELKDLVVVSLYLQGRC